MAFGRTAIINWVLPAPIPKLNRDAVADGVRICCEVQILGRRELLCVTIASACGTDFGHVSTHVRSSCIDRDVSFGTWGEDGRGGEGGILPGETKLAGKSGVAPVS